MEFKEECDICGKEDNLVDAIYEKNSVRLCSFCRTLPDVIMIEKPTEEQVRNTYKRYSFTARAKQQLQDRKVASPPSTFRGYTLEDLRKKRKDEEKKAEEQNAEKQLTAATPDKNSEDNLIF